MKYFTKEWFVKSKGNCDEVKKVVYKYRSYYKQIEPMLPLQLQHVLSDMHDCRLMDLAFDEENSSKMTWFSEMKNGTRLVLSDDPSLIQ